MISEREMERAIISNPEKYLKESGLKLISEQYRIGNYIFDLLFEDRHGAKLIIELQHGVLDRNHTYKILDYYHEYKEKNAASFIELMIIANKIPDERKKDFQIGVYHLKKSQNLFLRKMLIIRSIKKIILIMR